jgi:hypothetical protein
MISKMYRTEEKGLCITVPHMPHNLEELIKNNPSLKGLYSVLEGHAVHLNHHFDEDGWDLSADSILSDVLFELFGGYLLEDILQYLCQRLDTEIEYRADGKFMIHPRNMIWYNAKLNKHKVSKKRPSKNYEYVEIL